MDKNAAPFYKAAMELTTTTRLSFGQPVAEVANEHPEIVSQLHGALDLLTQASERPSCLTYLTRPYEPSAAKLGDSVFD